MREEHSVRLRIEARFLDEIWNWTSKRNWSLPGGRKARDGGSLRICRGHFSSIWFRSRRNLVKCEGSSVGDDGEVERVESSVLEWGEERDWNKRVITYPKFKRKKNSFKIIKNLLIKKDLIKAGISPVIDLCYNSSLRDDISLRVAQLQDMKKEMKTKKIFFFFFLFYPFRFDIHNKLNYKVWILFHRFFTL